MSSPPTSKRIKTSTSSSAPSPHHHHHHHLLLAQQQQQQQQQQQLHPFPRSAPFEGIPMSQAQIPAPTTTTNSRKRRSSLQSGPTPTMAAPVNTAAGAKAEQDPVSALNVPEHSPKKKGRTNTPWSAEEEQRLKTMRDAGRSWGEIVKTFPNRTEGSVKKHWYKDMHYAEFAEDESAALREAIKEYEANKWKVIGQKVGKPAKACEQYAKEHFKAL
ncbi:hypothetical protein MAP00_005058 [Monascus purpureus]|nr:hypothetical protein MAP00_005058 [Monascus purpureus]